MSRLVLVDFVPAGLKTLEAELQAGGAQVLVVAADVSKEDEVKDAIAKAVAAFGRIDYCVNSAGTAGLGALVETSTEDVSRGREGVW